MVDHLKSKGLGVLTDTEWASKFGVEPECFSPSSEALRKEEITLKSKGEGFGALTSKAWERGLKKQRFGTAEMGGGRAM